MTCEGSVGRSPRLGTSRAGFVRANEVLDSDHISAKCKLTANSVPSLIAEIINCANGVLPSICFTGAYVLRVFIAPRHALDMEQVVARDALRASESPSPPSSAVEIPAELTLIPELDFKTPEYEPNAHPALAGEDESELDFRLFRTLETGKGPTAGGDVHKVRVRSPSADEARLGKVLYSRKLEHYFTGRPTEQERQQFHDAAQSGASIRSLSKSAWPGCALSSKVVHLSSSQLSPSLRTELGVPAESTPSATSPVPAKRTRPGKKYRLKIRKKHQKLIAQEETRNAAQSEKEAAEREKRTRKNRERKAKRKKKENEKKRTPVDAAAGS